MAKRPRKTVHNHTAPENITVRLPYTSRKSLLTPGERRFYHDGLLPAVGNRYLICPTPRLADVITVENFRSKHGRRIAQKHVDFVLVTKKATRFVTVIELNDASHLEDDRQSRDAFVAEALRVAGIPLIAFPIYREYDPQKIRWHIKRALQRFKD